MCHTLTDSDFTRDQMLGESHQPLLFRKGKRLKEEVKRRQPPPDTPVVDVSAIAILLDEYMAEFILLYDFTLFQLYFQSAFSPMFVSLVTAYHQVWTAAMVHWWHRGNFAPISTGRPELVAILLGSRNRHNLGWWNGAWQDCADNSVSVLTLQRGLGANLTFFQMHLRKEGNRV